MNTKKKEVKQRRKIPILRYLLPFCILLFFGVKYYPYNFDQAFVKTPKEVVIKPFKHQLIRNDSTWKWERLVLIDTLLDKYGFKDFPYKIIKSSFYEMRSLGCSDDVRIDLYSQAIPSLDSLESKWKARVFSVKCSKNKQTYVNSRQSPEWYSWEGIKRGAYCWKDSSLTHVIGTRERPGVGWNAYRMYPGYSILNPDSSKVKSIGENYLLLGFWGGVDLEITNFQRTAPKLKLGSSIKKGVKIAYSKSLESPVEMRILSNGVPMSYEQFINSQLCYTHDKVFSWVLDVPYALPKRIIKDTIVSMDEKKEDEND